MISMNRLLNKFLAASAAIVLLVFSCTTARAVNILVNPGFDDDVQPLVNSNNFPGTVTGWAASNPFNVIRVDGGGYGGGPDLAQSGGQYLDLVSDASADDLWQVFTIVAPTDVTFSAYYSNREGTAPNRSASLGIYNATGTTLIGSSVSVDLSSDPAPSTVWTQTPLGSILNLAPGVYQVRSTLDGSMNVDSVVVDVDPGSVGLPPVPPVVSFETDKAPAGSGSYTPTFASGGPSSTDLIEGMSPSASSNPVDFQKEGSTGLPALTNGTFNTAYPGGPGLHDAYATAGAGSTVTYDLGGAFDLTEIVIYGGWNDGGRDQQAANILVSDDNGANFFALSSINTNPGVQGPDVTPVSTRSSIVDGNGGTLAFGITNVRVDFLGVENGYTGYAEIDVFGVPEPSSILLMVFGLIGLFVSQRRIRGNKSN